jgi:Right handed beta helix region
MVALRRKYQGGVTNRRPTTAIESYRPRFESLEDRRMLAVALVTTLADTIDFNDGVTSLREAVFAANTLSGPDTINFDPALTANGLGKILLTQGELKITESLTINGPGADLLTIDAQQHSRIFDIAATSGDFLIAGLTLSHGRTTSNNTSVTDATNNGGAIRSVTSGNLTLQQDRIVANSTTGLNTSGGGVWASGNIAVMQTSLAQNSASNSAIARGGGIYGGADIQVMQSTITGNSVAGTTTKTVRAGGGGIYSHGSTTISDSIVTGNSATGDREEGGGVVAGGVLSVSGSTVSLNSTSGLFALGGGLRAVHDFSATNTIIANNSTTGTYADGGGVAMLGGSGTISQCTISGNSTAGLYADAGGVSVQAGTVRIEQCVVSKNSTLGEYANGGGLAIASGITTLVESLITGNSTTGNYGNGAGIYQFTGNIEIDGSALISNSTAGIVAEGGGLCIREAHAILKDCTITSNTVSGDSAYGAGIYGWDGIVDLMYSTVSENHTNTFGGGIATGFSGSANIIGSIVALNSAGSSHDPDILVFVGGQLSVKSSLIGDNNGTFLAEAAAGFPDMNGNSSAGLYMA